MRDAEHDLSQQDSAVEITPLPAEEELSEAQKLSTGTIHQNASRVGRANRSGIRRYLLIALTLCLVISLILITVIVPRNQPPKPSSHAGTLATSPTLVPTATSAPAYVTTDYNVNTTIVNGVAYAGAANGAVYALRASDGKVLWRHKINTGASAAPLVSAGIIFITANIGDVGPGTLYALQTSDGIELWHYTSSDPLSVPLLDNGIVYVTSYDVVSQNGSLVALRASDGTQLWHDTARGFSYNAPVVGNEVVYVSTTADNGSGAVYALWANNGTQIWHDTTTTFTSVPLVSNGIAYLVSDQGLSALQASNGQLLWKVPVVGNTGLPPQVINDVLYLTTTTIPLAASASTNSQMKTSSQMGTVGNLLQSVVPMASVKQTLPLKQGLSSVYAVRISDGAVLWHYTFDRENGNNWANWLCIEDGTVYVGTYVDQGKSYIYALRSNNGSLLWRQAMYRGMSVNAFVAKGFIYIASFINDGSINAGSGAVYALRASDGSQLWYHPMYWVVYNPPMLVGATIYVSTAGGDVFAFQASNGSLLWHFHTDVQ
jgi:outer membrane protein assembly factor BamB